MAYRQSMTIAMHLRRAQHAAPLRKRFGEPGGGFAVLGAGTKLSPCQTVAPLGTKKDSIPEK